MSPLCAVAAAITSGHEDRFFVRLAIHSTHVDGGSSRSLRPRCVSLTLVSHERSDPVSRGSISEHCLVIETCRDEEISVGRVVGECQIGHGTAVARTDDRIGALRARRARPRRDRGGRGSSSGSGLRRGVYKQEGNTDAAAAATGTAVEGERYGAQKGRGEAG